MVVSNQLLKPNPKENVKCLLKTVSIRNRSIAYVKYIQKALRREVSHENTFGVYQDDTDDS